jgi:carboxypeptidase Q
MKTTDLNLLTNCWRKAIPLMVSALLLAGISQAQSSKAVIDGYYAGRNHQFAARKTGS